jgi:hypothetical protein
VAHDPEIAPGTAAAERADYGEVVLSTRLRDAHAGLGEQECAATPLVPRGPAVALAHAVE